MGRANGVFEAEEHDISSTLCPVRNALGARWTSTPAPPSYLTVPHPASRNDRT